MRTRPSYHEGSFRRHDAYHAPPVPLARLVSVPAFAVLGLVAAAPTLTACFPGDGGNVASRLAAPPSYSPAGESKCSVKKSAEHPLIVEWPSADRATLEAKAQSGLVAVRYVGCEMEVLHRCRLPGKYAYTAITPKHDAVTIRDADELYANMPVGAAKLEGKLEKTGQLQVSMTIVGRFEADHTSFTPAELDGDDCDRATHVVSGMTTGAFELSAGASATVGGQAGAFGAGAGGKSSSTHETLERDGREEKCEGGSSHAGEPPDGCGAVLRLDLVPLQAPKREKKVTTAEADVDAEGIAPNLYAEGNLRVAATCAEHRGALTPADGLRVVVDGKAEPDKPLKTNMMSSVQMTQNGKVTVPVVVTSASDIGFIVPPGPHHLSIQAPDCVTVETDVKLSGTHATEVGADMEVASEGLKGTVGAPWGFAWVLGGYYSQIPRSVLYQGQVTSIDGTPAAGGGTLGFTYEHRNFTIGVMYSAGIGNYSGIVKNPSPASGEYGGPLPFSGSQFENVVEVRAGVRLPLRYIALMAGSGIGGSMWISDATADITKVPTVTTIADVTAPQGINLFWHLPLWVAVDIKPVCDFGVQLSAAYNLEPTNLDGSYGMLGAALLWQPSPSCARPTGLSISP
jgi:hypothetical protein